MARRSNDLFIGADKLNLEGREIKHPALLKLFATINLNKISDDPIQLIGMDIETQADDGTLMLLGFWDGKEYHHYYKDEFISILFAWVRNAHRNDKSLVYWNRLDPFVLYKQFLLMVDDYDKRILSMEKFSKVSGEWDKENGIWTITPIVEIKMQGDMYFGIKNVIRSNVQFYFRREHSLKIHTVWAYDVAQLYQNGLEKEAMKHLDYYTKIDKSAHIVDWDRFETDDNYRNNIVLKSNELDSKAVYDLGFIIQEQFKDAFKYYPRTLISQGSIARAGIVATLKNMHGDNQLKITEDVKSIGIINYIDTWHEKYGEDFVKDFLCLTFEAYSGGQIEAYMYGFIKEAFTSDLTQAYPYHIEHLWDLRGADITYGTGEPPRKSYSYCLLRGDVHIPSNIDYHPLTIKHPMKEHRETNIRPVGIYRASYTIEERDFLISLGAKFENEEWYNVETLGELSPLAKVCKIFTDLRAKLKPLGKDYIAKISSASLYGILFEAVNTWIEQQRKIEVEVTSYDDYYKELLNEYKGAINLSSISHHLDSKVMSMWHNKDSNMYADMVREELADKGLLLHGTHPIDIILEINKLYRLKTKIKGHENRTITEVLKAGYRGGEFLNPLYATIITSRTRLQVSKASNIIKSKGGKPILVMTDSLFWEGSADMLPPEMIKPVKTVGYFEPVEKVKNLVCLGSGRYGFTSFNDKTKKWEQVVSKKRGLNAVDIHDPEGIIKEEFNWVNALKIMKRTKQDKIRIKVRALISVGMILHDGRYTYKDLGRIVEEYRDVDVVVGKSKRLYDDDIKDASLLADHLIPTDPISIGFGMDGTGKINDQTLPELRRLMMLKTMSTRKEKRKGYQKIATKNYFKKNGDQIKKFRKQNYEYLKQYGYSSKERSKMQCWSIDKIQKQLLEDNKI